MDKSKEIEPVILHYLQGVASEEEMKALRAWISESEENRKLFFQLKQVYDLRRGGLYPGKKEIEESWERLFSKIKRMDMGSFDPEPNENRFWRIFVGVLKYAAVATIFVCLTLGIQQLTKKADTEVFYTEIDMEAGPRMSRMTLPDGSKVILNASTKLRYPNRFDSRSREVFLDGEAYFEVVHHKEQPFIVRTEHQQIKVLGTTFNVMDYSADDYAITTLVEGSVEVQMAGKDGIQGEKRILKPNHQAFIDKTNSELVLENVNIDPARTWVNKIYHFRDEPLYRIMKRLEKLYGVKINIDDDVRKDDKYTGVFRMELSIEEIIKIVNYQKQFTYKITGEQIEICSLKNNKK
jgi:ferric-dicitrate binding protein FerR (iron transport regulator)